MRPGPALWSLVASRWSMCTGCGEEVCLSSCPITESQIDIIKENISHCCEAIIDHSQLLYQRKKNRSAK